MIVSLGGIPPQGVDVTSGILDGLKVKSVLLCDRLATWQHQPGSSEMQTHPR